MKPTRLLVALAILVGVLASIPAIYQTVTGQPIGANTLVLTDAPSGVAPAVRASGRDTNISINVVPKGTGALQVNGVPVTVSGGTFTSLNVNPGPLNVTGALFVQPGTNGTLKGVGARIAHNVTDAATTGVAIETLYTFAIPGNTLTADGQSLLLEVLGTSAANANNKTLTLVFGATTIGTIGPVAANNEVFRATCWIYRTGAATQKAVCEGVHKASTDVGGTATFGINQFSTPAEVLAGAVSLLVRGTTPTAAGDFTARAATLDWYPVGQ